jgi:uncharacterized protein (TIGR03435 family)
MRILKIAGPVVFAAATLCALIGAEPSRVQSQSQTAATSTFPYQFEVVSIRPITPGANPSGFGAVYSRDGLLAKGVTVWWLLREAYGVQRIQIMGVPKEMDSERFIIDARVDDTTADALEKLTPNQLGLVRQRMLQAVLADRFKLTFHHETRELPVYILSIAKNGSKLQDAKPDHVGPNDLENIDGKRATDNVSVSLDGDVVGQAASVTTLAGALSRDLGRAVLDRTGLSGKYDFTFKFAHERMLAAAPPGDAATGQPAIAAPDPSGHPPLNKALEDSLGLKLESGKGPVDLIVIDHVERPSDN